MEEMLRRPPTPVPPPRGRRFRSGLAVLLGLACAACGGRAPLYPVSGKVTYRGSPASGAAVYFHRRGSDESPADPIMGVVKEDGSFELVCGARGKGAPPGEYDVLIEWKRFPRTKGGRPQTGPDKLKGRYADPKHPPWSVEVRPEPNELPPFELTD
jgi:hypothetical protein